MDSRNVERVLEQQGRSVAWLAGKAGVSVSYAWLMLNGKRPLTEAFKKAAVEALGVPADLLFAPQAAAAGEAS